MDILYEKNLQNDPNSIPRNKSSSTTGISTTVVASDTTQKKGLGRFCSVIGSWLKTPKSIAILETRDRPKPIPKQKRS